MYAFFVVLGFTALITTFFPLGSYLLELLTGGMYGAGFRTHSPALYFLASIALNYGLVSVLVGIALRKYGVVKRVPVKYRSPVLFGLGSVLIVLTLAARVLAATVEGGGAGFAVASLSFLVVYPALIMLAIAAVKFFIGVGAGKTRA